MRYFWTTAGKKVLMAVSGMALFGFILAHLMGNLIIFAGPDAFNGYAERVEKLGGLLWAVRGGLLGMLILHVWTAISLTLENRAARPVPYQSRTYLEASYASRTMHLSGLIVLAYLIYHLLHFTFHKVHPEFGSLQDSQGRHDVYQMVVLSFRQPTMAWIYILANFLLGTHLSHGLYSLLQTLGVMTEKTRGPWQKGARLAGYGLFLGFASIPAAVWWGIVR